MSGTVLVTVASCAGASGAVWLVAVERAIELLELLEQRLLAPLERFLALLRLLHRSGDLGLPRREIGLLFALVHARQATGIATLVLPYQTSSCRSGDARG